MQRAGLQVGDRVALLLHNSMDYVERLPGRRRRGSGRGSAERPPGSDTNTPTSVRDVRIPTPSTGVELRHRILSRRSRHGKVVHWPTHPPTAGRGALRAGMPGERDHRPVDQAALADHDREASSASSQDLAHGVPQPRRAIRHPRRCAGGGRRLGRRRQPPPPAPGAGHGDIGHPAPPQRPDPPRRGSRGPVGRGGRRGRARLGDAGDRGDRASVAGRARGGRGCGGGVRSSGAAQRKPRDPVRAPAGAAAREHGRPDRDRLCGPAQRACQLGRPRGAHRGVPARRRCGAAT